MFTAYHPLVIVSEFKTYDSELLMRFNQEMAIGNWEINWDDGQYAYAQELSFMVHCPKMKCHYSSKMPCIPCLDHTPGSNYFRRQATRNSFGHRLRKITIIYTIHPTADQSLAGYKPIVPSPSTQSLTTTRGALWRPEQSLLWAVSA